MSFSPDKWKSHLSRLAELEADIVYHEFPSHYIDLSNQISMTVPQISLTPPTVQVYCKLSDELTSLHYLGDEEILPKIVCWNDISALNGKMATKMVKVSLENEYKALVPDISLDFQSVSTNNSAIPQISNKDILIYHVLDPALNEQSTSSGTTSVTSLASLSVKRNKLERKSKAQSTILTPLYTDIISEIQTTDEIRPIQNDPDSLQRIAQYCYDNHQSIIFILDCSYAQKAIRAIQQINPRAIIFAATTDCQIYSPSMPCDLFTSALLTPAKVALLWQSQVYSDIQADILSEMNMNALIDLINDSPAADAIIEMLNSSLESIVDQMIFDNLNTQKNLPLFSTTFRRDHFTARLFSAFFLASRIMKTISQNPICYPTMPDLSFHPLWDAFDLQVDRALFSLKSSLLPSPPKLFTLDTLLSEAMEKLEIWAWFPTRARPSPEELPYLPYLIRAPKFFLRCMKFISIFISISVDNTIAFLYTRSIPMFLEILSEIINSTKEENQTFESEISTFPILNEIQSFDDKEHSLALFNMIIIQILLIDPSLMSSFSKYLHLWHKLAKSNRLDLKKSSLSLLLLLSNNDSEPLLTFRDYAIEMTKHEDPEIRALSHLILSKLHTPLSLPIEKIESEPNPLCRSALITRYSSTMEYLFSLSKDNSKSSDDHHDLHNLQNGQSKIFETTNMKSRMELFFDLIPSFNDLSMLVREEGLVALSEIFKCEDDEFLGTLKDYLSEWRDDIAKSPLITLLGNEMKILQYEPSNRVRARFSEFLTFLVAKFHKEEVYPLKSSITKGIVSRINADQSLSECEELRKDYDQLTFSLSPLAIPHSAASLTGIPALSQIGLISCGDSEGRIFSQQGGEKISVGDYFGVHNLNANISSIPGLKISQNSPDAKAKVSFMMYIDNTKLLAVSNRNQAVIIDNNISTDAISSFWMSPPDLFTTSYSDCNRHTFEVIQSTGKPLISSFSLITEQPIFEIRSSRQSTTALGWLKPYSSLFYAAQNDLIIYDSRMKTSALTLENAGYGLISCNSSVAMPFYLVSGYNFGLISMYDMRNLQQAAEKDIKESIKQFDVHSQIPFCLAQTGTKLYSISFETGLQLPKIIEIPNPQSFALHPTENSCAIKCGNQINTYIVDY